MACEEGHLNTVQHLLAYGAHIDNKNEDEQTPFHLAAKLTSTFSPLFTFYPRAGHLDVVELLLERDHSAIFDKDEENNTALHLASTACMTKTVEALLKQVPLLD